MRQPSPPADDQDIVAARNLGAYLHPGITRWYAALSGLTPAEEVVLADSRAHWADRDVLDIGIGGGRTTAVLAPDARRYVGIDFSISMIAAAKASLPGLDLRRADARRMPMFRDGAFDFVLFSFNGLDSVNDASRAVIMAEVTRVLKPGGAFVFSGHNLDWTGKGGFLADMFRVKISSSPLKTAKAIGRVGVRIRNWLRNQKAAVRTDRYAVMTDPGNDFASPHYYAGAAETRRQVEAAGLELVNVYDGEGKITADAAERASSTLYYLTRKPL